MCVCVCRCMCPPVGRGFASRPGHTKDHHKNGTNSPLAWHAMH